jgi:hypothetical protein
MRVSWVHPSWRDLVIEELARDGELRRRFLAHCGVDGAALALSSGGGPAGERVRPLLTEDADWDALGDGLCRVCAEMDHLDAVRLLTVIGQAVDAVEAGALAALVLERLERRWNGHAVEVEVLEAWTEVARRLPPAPTLAATWLELEPAAAPATPVELERFADWLRLAELLRVHDDDLLERFGFPRRFSDVLDAFADARPAAEPPVERELRADARMRLVRLDPPRADQILRTEPDDVVPAVVQQFQMPAIDPLAPSFAIDRVLRDLVD